MNYIVGIDLGAGPEYAGETIWAFSDGKWVIVSMMAREVKS